MSENEVRLPEPMFRNWVPEEGLHYYTADQMRAMYEAGRREAGRVEGWQPIESAPKDRLCFVWHEGWIDADACWWDSARKLWREHRGDAVVSPQPSHFYPIPLPLLAALAGEAKP